MTHTKRTRQVRRTGDSATKPRYERTFSPSDYLKELMAELDRAAISERLAEAREEAGLTQPEMGELLDVHYRAIQNWESPKKKVVPWDRIDEWARITDCSKYWLLHGEEQAPLTDQPLLAELVHRVRQLVQLLEAAQAAEPPSA